MVIFTDAVRRQRAGLARPGDAWAVRRTPRFREDCPLAPELFQQHLALESSHWRGV